MNKAFIFDMDGVLVDSESLWAQEDSEFHSGIFGKEIADKIGNTTGVSLKTVYEAARGYGTNVPENLYVREFDKRAASIYARASLTEGTEKLADFLISRGFKLGLVSASQQCWIECVIARLSFSRQLEVVISVNDTPGLRSKPAPDGYTEALRRLGVTPSRGIVLEDSNRGIESGKAAGCFVIGFSGNLISGYEQTGADAYANTMDDVITLVETFTQQ